jgi:uncharacterized protein YqeY
MLKQKFSNEMVVALKAGETRKLTIYRNLMAQIQNAQIDKKADLTDEEIIVLLRKQIKSLEEANAMFVKGGRDDLANENKIEIDLLKSYLPAEIAEEELRTKVEIVLKANETETNIGKLIGLCVRELKGTANSGRIAQLVKKMKS